MKSVLVWLCQQMVGDFNTGIRTWLAWAVSDQILLWKGVTFVPMISDEIEFI